MRRFISLAVVLVAALAALSSSPALADSANNAFRFGVGWIEPDGEAVVNSGLTNVKVSADSATAFYVDYERRLIPWLGLDFEAMYAKPDITATPVSGGPTATQSEQTITGSGGVNFHVFARSRFDLYVGAYAAWTKFDQTFDDAFGYGALVGFDVGLTKSGLALNASVRYTKTDADFKQISGASAPYDPLLFQLGLGWRF